MEKTKKVYITRNDLFKDFPMILCNEITKADENFIEDNYELFYTECEACNGKGEDDDGNSCKDCSGEGSYECEAYQYFLVSCSDWKVEQLRSYGVELGTSQLLDVQVMPIYDWGTSWSCFSYSKEVPEDYTLAHNETLTRSTVY